MNKTRNSVVAVCDACDGTGLYEGMCERPGEPVICAYCRGTGGRVIDYTPFVRRKMVKGVKCVRVSRGCCIATGVGGVPYTEMTYDEFLKKYK